MTQQGGVGVVERLRHPHTHAPLFGEVFFVLCSAFAREHPKEPPAPEEEKESSCHRGEKSKEKSDGFCTVMCAKRTLRPVSSVYNGMTSLSIVSQGQVLPRVSMSNEGFASFVCSESGGRGIPRKAMQTSTPHAIVGVDPELSASVYCGLHTTHRFGKVCRQR